MSYELLADLPNKVQKLSGFQNLACAIVRSQDKLTEKWNFKEQLERFKTLDLDNAEGASNLAEFRALTADWKRAKQGLPVRSRVSLDATASGPQILSMLSGCQKTWRICGGNPDRPSDLYMEVFVQGKLRDVLPNLTKKQLKNKAIMPAYYGSKRGPEGVFGEYLDTFNHAMETLTPHSWSVAQILADSVERLKEPRYQWVLPDNFFAHKDLTTYQHRNTSYKGSTVQVQNEVLGFNEMRSHRGMGANSIHSLDAFIAREMLRRCAIRRSEPNPELVERLVELFKKTGFMSVRIAQHITKDSYAAQTPEIQAVIADIIKTMPKERFDIVPVHDCFRALPNHGNTLRSQYNICLAQLSQSRLLSHIFEEIHNKPFEKPGFIPLNEILGCSFSLC